MDPLAVLFPFGLGRAARQWALLLGIDPVVYKTKHAYKKKHEMREGTRRWLRVEDTHRGLGNQGAKKCGDAK